MSEIKDGGSAFPIPGWKDDPTFNGITLRDYFAAKAMQGWLSSYASDAEHPSEYPGALYVHAQNAYAMADAMLRAREAS